MLWDFVVWLLVLGVQAALLGIVMFSVSPLSSSVGRVSCSRFAVRGLLDRVLLKAWLEGLRSFDTAELATALLTSICPVQLIMLSDLENDFVNPHDASAKINKWVVSPSCQPFIASLSGDVTSKQGALPGIARSRFASANNTDVLLQLPAAVDLRQTTTATCHLFLSARCFSSHALLVPAGARVHITRHPSLGFDAAVRVGGSSLPCRPGPVQCQAVVPRAAQDRCHRNLQAAAARKEFAHRQAGVLPDRLHLLHIQVCTHCMACWGMGCCCLIHVQQAGQCTKHSAASSTLLATPAAQALFLPVLCDVPLLCLGHSQTGGDGCDALAVARGSPHRASALPGCCSQLLMPVAPASLRSLRSGI